MYICIIYKYMLSNTSTHILYVHIQIHWLDTHIHGLTNMQAMVKGRAKTNDATAAVCMTQLSLSE